MTDSQTFEVSRGDLAQVRITTLEAPSLGAGEVRFRVGPFALTANNVTYGVAGDALGYWDFFPSDDPAWGRVPAMGWGDVVESNHPDVEVGGRYYGWFPMATELITTVSVTPEGLRDDGDHRVEHASIYRSFNSTAHDPLYQPGADAEARHALLRGLFLTGFLIDGHMALDAPDAEQAVVLSASAKTAIAYAETASKRGITVVGLTSARNADFVRSLGYYDVVATYDDIAEIPQRRSVVVDIAGDGMALAAVHEHLGDNIDRSLTVGKSHHDAEPVSVAAGPQPQFFFAPTAIRALSDAHGAANFQQAMATALFAFVEGSRQWLTLEHYDGPGRVESAWQRLYAGEVAPNVGIIASMTNTNGS